MILSFTNKMIVNPLRKTVVRSLLPALLLLGVSPAVHSAPPANSPEARQVQAVHQRYQRQKFGLFVHYVPALTVDPKTNQSVQDIDALARDFDAGQFAQDAADFGVEYVIFTVHHLGARMLYPSAVNKRWRDDQRKPGGTDEKNWKTWSDTDPIDRLATELAKKKIDLHLYVHPVDGHDFSREDQDNTGWNDCDTKAGEHTRWNDYQNELFDELCKRYGTRIKGLWFDGMYLHSAKHPMHGCIDQPRFRKTLLKHNPALILTANVAGVRDKNPCADWVAADYRGWECNDITGWSGLRAVNPNADPANAFTWPGTKVQMSLVISGSWWASNKNNNLAYSVPDLYRYLVLQASVSKSGGFVVSAGCFPGSVKDQPNGNIWEGNVREGLLELNKLIAPVAESIKNTNASEAYVTEDHERLEQKGWGVATDAPDGSATYLHVLRPPDSNTLQIGKPANGIGFRSASLLPSGKPVDLKGDVETGYTVSLPEGATWDKLDTVIKLAVDPASVQRRLSAARQALTAELAKLKTQAASHPSHPQIEQARQAIAAAGALTANASVKEWQSATDALRRASEMLDEVPPPPAELNLALAKPVQTSSAHPSTSADVITKSDRSSPAFWSSGDDNAKADHEETVTIDLGAEKQVGSVYLFPRRAGSVHGFPLDFDIKVSTDGQTWKTVRSVKDAALPTGEMPRRFAFDATPARHIQIHSTRLRALPDDQNFYRMQLAGIEVFPPSN